MSLNWNVSRIARQDLVWIKAETDNRAEGIKAGESYLAPRTDALIWATMAVDLGAITTGNVDEFTRRIELWQAAFGPSLRKGDGTPAPLTRDDVANHVGLATNVQNTTNKQFDRKLGDAMVRDLNAKVRYAQQRATARGPVDATAQRDTARRELEKMMSPEAATLVLVMLPDRQVERLADDYVASIARKAASDAQ